MSLFRQTLHNILRLIQQTYRVHQPHSQVRIADVPNFSKVDSDFSGEISADVEDKIRSLIGDLPQHSDQTSRLLALASAAQRDPSVARAVETILERWAAGCGEAPWATLLALPDEIGMRVGARVLRGGVGDGVRTRAWVSCVKPGLSRAAIDRLSKACGLPAHESVLGRSALVLRWARRATLGCGKDAKARRGLIAGLIPAGVELSEEGWEGAGRMLRVLNAEAPLREAWAAGTLTHSSARVRFSGLRTSPRRSVIDFAFDADERIARTAVLGAAWGAGVNGEGSDVAWSGLARSAHAGVRSIAREVRGARGLLWSEEGWAIAGLLRRMSTDAEGVERDWRGAWEDDEAGRVGLLRIARRIGLLAWVADVVERAADAGAEPGSAEARVAATAVVVAGDGTRAAKIVSSCLRAADARVRANAVETCGPAVARDALVELKADPHHRVRANALRQSVLTGETLARSVRSLVELVESSERMDRLAGAWVLPRIAVCASAGMRVAAGRLLERRLSREDDARVRARLRDAAGRLGVAVEVDQTGLGLRRAA
jgi:hypothetical protein